MSKFSNMCALEWKARCELAALYRLMAHFHMTDIIETHISLCIDGMDDFFLINKYGVLFDDIKASDFIKISISNKNNPTFDVDMVSPAGLKMHSSIHSARRDMKCIIHTHTVSGAAVSSQKHGILPISQYSLMFYNRIAYHDYEGVIGLSNNMCNLVKNLGEHRTMILRNHGLLTSGRTVAEAFFKIYFLERACQIQVQALSTNGALITPKEGICLRDPLIFRDSNNSKCAGI